MKNDPHLIAGNRRIDLSQPRIMGVLNVTPDSFSDGSKFQQPTLALAHARQMMMDGASFIDVGGESTRPGASVVSEAEELDRVIPVIERLLNELDVAISVDTSSPVVMLEAANAGAHLINDVRALRKQGALEAAAKTGLPVCLMHMQGTPETMQDHPMYDNLMQDIRYFFQDRIKQANDAGIDDARIVLDPGFGFGKNTEHNYTLLNRLDQITSLPYPVLTGLSRKRMIAAVLAAQALDQSDAESRDLASSTAAALCVMKGAKIIRVHNVHATWQALQIVNATLCEGFDV